MIGFIKTYPADFIWAIGGKKSQENQLNATSSAEN